MTQEKFYLSTREKTTEQEEIDMYRISGLEAQAPYKAQKGNPMNWKTMVIKRQGQDSEKDNFNWIKETGNDSISVHFIQELKYLTRPCLGHSALRIQPFLCIFSWPVSLRIKESSDATLTLPPAWVSSFSPSPLSDKLPTSLWNMTHKAQCHYKPAAMADLWIQLPLCL